MYETTSFRRCIPHDRINKSLYYIITDVLLLMYYY